MLQRQGLISLWHDQLIVPGEDWAKFLDTHLETASVILLLVSADFLATDYCYSVGMKRALERQEAGKARVVPILIRPADWEGSPLAHLSALPTNAKPISSWQNKDTALADVAASIRRVIVEDLPQLTASASRAALPKMWNIPYPRNPFFLGRETELAQVHQRLQGGQATALSQPQAVSGLGGIGKTQLALEYAYRYHQDYQVVLWARAESTEALVSSYVAIATLLQLPEREVKEQDVTVQAVKIWLRTHRDWLFILDNADELALLPDFLPPNLGGHLLLTTRAAATGRLAHRLEIETLPPEQGALFLLRRAALLAPDAGLSQVSPQEQELALQMSQELGGLPLALDQAGAYLEETGMDLASYWQIYQQRRTDLLEHRGGLVADHPAPVSTTWSLSFQKVEEKNPAAADLLRMCAFLSPDAIAEEVLTAGGSLLGLLLAEVTADAFRLNQAIEALRAYSFVRRDPKGKTLSVHRLVQAVVQDKLTETERRSWAERATHSVNSAFPDVEPSTWPQCERLLPQALTATQVIEQYQIIGGEAGRLLHETASYLQARARYAEAEPLYQRALWIRKQCLGSESLQMAASLTGLASLYREQGKYAEAEPLYQRALRISEQRLGLDHLQVTHPLNGLALLYWDRGKYAEAEPLYQRVLRIRELHLGFEHPQVAYPLNGLARLYREQGKYAEAELLYQRALRIWEQHLGPEHPDVADSLNGLAHLYRAQGKYAEAESLYQRALRIREQHVGPEHPQVAYPLDGLASLYRAQGKYAEAESLCQRALRIREQYLGPEHPNVAYPLHNLASLYRAQGKYAEAEPLYQRALRIWEQHLGPEYPQVAYPLNNLASLYREQGKYAEAEPLYQRALHIREQVLGPEHPETAATMYSLARLREVQGNREEACIWYARTLAVLSQTLGERHPKTARTRKRFIALLHTMGQHEQATQLEVAQSEP
jgi:tetratricopeptide (TPR) repeat protein